MIESKVQPMEQVTISRSEYDDLLALKTQNGYLLSQLEEMRRMIFGSKSERYKPVQADPNQLDLFTAEEMQTPVEDTESPEKETITYERDKSKRSTKPVRSKLPEHLRRETEVIEPDFIPDGAVKIGEAITEILEYKPAEVFVRAIVRPKYAVPTGEDETSILIAPLPSLPIVKGNAGASLLSHICVSKFIDHLPFHRQIKMFKREKIPIAESTLKGWYGATCRLLAPLYEKLKTEILLSDYLQVDESPMPVLTADKPGSTHKGYMWVFHAPVEGMVCFHYDKSRAGEVVRHFLEDYRGAIQTDAYAGYDQYSKSRRVLLLGCAAHARRKFEHARNSSPQLSHEALALFRKLYRVEEEARQNKTDDPACYHQARYELRREKAASIMEELKAWLDKQQGTLLPASPIGQAVNYTLNIWQRLERYLLDGKYETDNNLIENQIRPLALGRRNYLFSGSHEGAGYNAMMYSFFACCKRAEVNPTAWLIDVLNRIPEYHASKLTDLLPHNWAQTQK